MCNFIPFKLTFLKNEFHKRNFCEQSQILQKSKRHFTRKTFVCRWKSIAYINQIENRDSWPQPEMVDKIAVALNIPSSALFEENGSPQNKKDLFENTFGKSLESELLSRIEKDVKEVCSLM